MKSVAEKGIFSPTSKETLELIKTLNTTKQHTFLIPTRFISSESGQVGYLLNEYFNWNREKQERLCYRSFFGNSRFDALQGAIKIARFHSHKNAAKQSKRIILCDPTLESRYFIDPLGRGEIDALIPGITIVPTLDEIDTLLMQNNNPLAVIVCVNQNVSAATISALFSNCKKQKIITILEQVDLDITSPTPFLQSINPLPDIIVTGESFTHYEIPYGAFSMTESIHKPWTSLQHCTIHSSTYAGNRLVLTKIRDSLLQNVPFFKSNRDIHEQCSKIEHDDDERLKAFSRYINPGLVKLYALTGLDVNPIKAHGSQLTILTSEKTEKPVLDCVSGGGAVIRGHTPKDVIPEVITLHDPRTNYWEALQKRFKELTSLPYSFPAVSGATAVDIGMSLALLANKDKTQVVIFKNNYAGKTLLSLIGSEESTGRTPFFPLYKNVTYIDPFAPEARDHLTAILTSGKVALIWFEILQGATAREIPQDLINIINTYKEKHGYIVGVDEVLMGFFRTGTLFSHKNTVTSPDIVTLSKALSDATFPMAITLVSSDVYKKALSSNPAAVHYYEKLYLNQLGSHIALHCLDKLLSPDIEDRVQRVSEMLYAGISEIGKNSPFIREVAGKGLFYRLYYKNTSQLFMLFFCYQCLTRTNTFLFFDRCIPALRFTEADAEQLLKNLRDVFYRGKFPTYFQFYLYVLKAVTFALLLAL